MKAAQDMKIIETRRAPNPCRVRIFLAEKGVSMAYEEVGMMQGELRTREFTALNPSQQVPVLVLNDGTLISETMAICRYFEDLHPEPALFGRGALGRAIVEMWNRRIEFGLFFHLAQVFRHLNPRMVDNEVPQVLAWGEANRPKINVDLERLDRRLAETPYVAGDDFSVADITAIVALDFMKPAKLSVPEGLEHLETWRERVAARPSVAA